MTKPQRYWMALLTALTYQSSMAWTIYWHYPNIDDIDLQEMQKWNVATLSRQRYARDTKYNKGRIAEQTESIRRLTAPHGGIAGYYERLIDDDAAGSFQRCYEATMAFYKFGRMTSWLACQNLFEVCDLPIKPPTMLATDPSNWSVRSGLMYLYNRDDLVEAGSDRSVRLTKADLRWVEDTEHELYKRSKTAVHSDNRSVFSNYLLESHLCQYKKLLTGGDYGGHSSGDHVSRASWLRERWANVNYDAFFKQATNLHHPLVRGKRESPALRALCAQTGQVINMHEDYDDLPNMYAELHIDPDQVGERDYEPVIKQRIELYSKAQAGGWASQSRLLRLYENP